MKPGTRLGSYEVIALIGMGGMGEVYRARFRREAHLLAALNHPHIATLHGFEDAGPVPALVMELVDGDTLAQIAGGPIPVDEALAIARQIGAALDAAPGAGSSIVI